MSDKRDDHENEPHDGDGPLAGGNYKVGYCKPPLQHRFGKGNKAAKGRRSTNAETIDEMLTRLGHETVDFVDRGRRKKSSYNEWIMRQARRNAAKGGPRDIKCWFDLQASRKSVPTAPSGVDHGKLLREKLELMVANRRASADFVDGDDAGGTTRDPE